MNSILYIYYVYTYYVFSLLYRGLNVFLIIIKICVMLSSGHENNKSWSTLMVNTNYNMYYIYNI